MAENWQAVIADVQRAMRDVGFEVTLRKRTSGPAAPWDTAATVTSDTPLWCIDDRRRQRDATGNLLAQSLRTLTVSIGEAIPAKADRVIVRGEVCEIKEVRPLAPGGVDLLYELDLAG